LRDATSAVTRLRTFHERMKISNQILESGFNDSETPFDPQLPSLIEKADREFTDALANDLNTSVAIAAIFDLVRAGNAAADAGKLRPTVAGDILRVLDRFDRVFAVLEDKDSAIADRAVAWAKSEGRFDEISPDLFNKLSDADIDALVAERTQAKKQRNFARADAIRNDLLEKGILLEDSKDGVRWKRK
ncbi:MAG: cysteine--tRNA ligase, partial [Acidobacteriota bacterium]|nr:cysteine--tRNA ligase [Acidobacteriota bacterium]